MLWRLMLPHALISSSNVLLFKKNIVSNACNFTALSNGRKQAQATFYFSPSYSGSPMAKKKALG